MFQRICITFFALIVAVSVLECTLDLTPLEMLTKLFAGGDAEQASDTGDRTVIRMGIASWQLGLFPWKDTIRQYEAAHGGKIKIKISAMPEGAFNSMQAFWRFGYTSYDVVVAWADEEIYPFIAYQQNDPDPDKRSLIVDVTKYLSREQLDTFVPAMFTGSSRTDNKTGRIRRYELPWMGDVLAMNYNKVFFKQRGVKVPTTWQEVEQACEKLKGLEYKGVQVAPISMDLSQNLFFAQNCYIPMLAAFRGDKGITDEQGHLDVSSDEAVRVFETIKRWYDKDYINHKSCMVSAIVEQDLRVLRTAMYPHWQTGGLEAIQDHSPEMIGIAPTPRAETCGTLISTYGCIIPKCSPVIEAAVEFSYEAFCTDKYGFQTAVAIGKKDPKTGEYKGGGKMPAIKSVYDQESLPADIVKLGKSLSRGYFFPDLESWLPCREILAVEFGKYLDNKTPSAAEALKIVQERFAEEIYSRQ
ncbi:MAG: extracellular solute-binding protein [Planctomycetes bacterium]|nr:extracellular solute-binding protein [Planctomycetota bacterium]